MSDSLASAQRSPVNKVLVIGCGVAGPAVAMFCQQAGIEPVIYEAGTEPAGSQGLFLNVAPNGLNILRTLGIRDDVVASGFRAACMTIRNSRGKKLGQIPLGSPVNPDLQSLMVKRGVLNETLANEAIRRGIQINFNKKLTEVTVVDRKVVAHFDDLTTVEADLLIGCDGIHSRTRQIIASHEAKPVYKGWVGCGGFTHLPNVPAPYALNLTLGKRAFFGYSAEPSGGVYWFSNSPLAAEPGSSEPAAISYTNTKDRLIDLHKDDHYPIPDIIRSTDSQPTLHHLYQSITLSQWHHGPIVLVGDSAHGTSPHGGQGASMALESAMVLAKCLRDIPNTELALSSYERMRKPRTEAAIRLSQRNSERMLNIGSPIQSIIRDLSMRVRMKTMTGVRSRTQMHSYTMDWSEKVDNLRVMD